LTDAAEEQRMLEEKVGKALAEARAKLDTALGLLSNAGADPVKNTVVCSTLSLMRSKTRILPFR